MTLRIALVFLLHGLVGCSAPADSACTDTSCDPAPPTCPTVRPVVLVHGINGSSADYDEVVQRLLADGWPADYVVRFDAVDPKWGCNADNALAIGELVAQVLAQTGQERVDLVAHSMGTLSARTFLKNAGGTQVVNSYTSLGGMNHGLASSCSAPDFLNVCVWEEICETNDFVTQLNADPATPGPTLWASIYGTADTTIPNESSYLEGALNIAIPDVDHVGLLHDDATYAALKTQLELPCW